MTNLGLWADFDLTFFPLPVSNCCREIRALPNGMENESGSLRVGTKDAARWPTRRPTPRSRRSGSAPVMEFERMNEFDIGTSTPTLSPSIVMAGEVDEEPPGSYGRPARGSELASPCHHPSQVQQRLWPLGLPEALRPPHYRGHTEEVTTAIVPRPSRTSPRAGLSQGLLPRRDRQAVERLALAGPEPHPQPPADRKDAQSVRRRACGLGKGGRNPARRHHALLHESDFGGRPLAAAAADDHPHGQRIRPSPRRVGRPAG